MSTLIPSHPSLNVNKAAGLLHKGLPPADGFYWMRFGVAPMEPIKIYTLPDGSRVSEFHGTEAPLSTAAETGAYFWGPITPPDELRNAERLMP